MAYFNYGKKLDQLDYEVLGVKEIWFYLDTVIMLTSFEMEGRGFYEAANSRDVYDKVFDKYETYLDTCLYNKRFEYYDGLDPKDKELDALESPGQVGFDIETASFNKNTFLNYAESNNICKIDIIKLKRFLSGDEVPNAPVINNKKFELENVAQRLVQLDDGANVSIDMGANGSQAEQSAVRIEIPNPATLSLGNAASQQYSFVRRTNYWDIRFGSVTLHGLKKLEGMDYIAVMLQHPYCDFGVTELRSMFNPDSIGGKGDKIKGDSYFALDDEEPTVEIYLQEKQEKDNTVLLPYRQQLKDLSLERAEAEREGNDAEIDRINTIVSMIEEEINNVLRNKHDDPELEKNRRSVWKNISKARESIRAEELEQGYANTPIYNHLKNYIQTGKTCIYNPPLEDKPAWSF